MEMSETLIFKMCQSITQNTDGWKNKICTGPLYKNTVLRETEEEQSCMVSSFHPV